MSADPTKAGVAQLARALQRRRLSARELLEAFLERTGRLNPKVNAIVTLDAHRALRNAAAIDAARARGKPLPALAGIPITVKDSFETAGLRTTCGAPQWAKHVPERNAEAIQRLVAAGCIIFGKSNTPIYAGDLQTYNTLFGVSANPWDLSRSCGGSSGGAAAAAACRLSAFDLGSDIGGSSRTPAHFCGVYGHKPTYGLVPFRGHIPPPPGSRSVPDLAVAGPIARSAQDLALILRHLVDSPERLKQDNRRMRQLRAAVWFDDRDFPLDAAVREVLEAAADALGEAGAQILRRQPAGPLARLFDDYLRLLWPITTAHLSSRALARLHEAAAGRPEDRCAVVIGHSRRR